jgi:uncharacterized membrane protein
LVAPIVVTVLAYLHIISAMGWLGGAVLFVSVLAPGLRSLTSSASLEFLAKVGPKSTRFFAFAATATIVFGLALLLAIPELLGTPLVFGIGLGLVAYLTAVLTMLSFRKVDDIANEILAGKRQGPPPPEFTKALRRGGLSVTATTLLLVLALIFMVTAGFPF